MKCDECTCTYESCSCKLPGSKCAYETDDEKDNGVRKINQDDQRTWETERKRSKRNGGQII